MNKAKTKKAREKITFVRVDWPLAEGSKESATRFQPESRV